MLRDHPQTVPAETLPVETKGERTRSRLLDLAIRRFAAEGFRRTSVSDIARDASLTPAAVYAYFAGKEALFEAAVDADAAALIDEARTASAGGSIHDREVRFISTLIGRVEAHPLARRVLGGLEPEVVDRLLRLPALEAFTEELARELADAQRAGDVRADVDPALLARGLETIVLSLLMGHVQTGAGADEERSTGVAEVLDAAFRPPRA